MSSCLDKRRLLHAYFTRGYSCEDRLECHDKCATKFMYHVSVSDPSYSVMNQFLGVLRITSISLSSLSNCFDKGINWSGERRPRTQRLFFGKVEQELNRDLWARVLDVAYEVEHSSNSIISRDHGLLKLIFLLPDIIEKIKLVKKEVQEKISKNISTFANSPNKPIEDNSSIYGLRKTTLAYRVYNDKSIVGNFDIRAWCIVNQEHNEKKLLQKIFNQVIGLKERFNENDIDDDVFDKSGDDMLVKLKDHVVPRLLEYIKISKILDHHSKSSATMTEDQLVELLDAFLVNLHYLPKIILVSLEVMHICSTILEASMSAEVGCFIKKLLEAAPDILGEYMIHLQQHMINAITPSTSP
ncbi:hypothetical protein BC332_13734 [Capsicum chinense]|nr:hypothetical protein BC332_13734 [Capsicum chinense]